MRILLSISILVFLVVVSGGQAISQNSLSLNFEPVFQSEQLQFSDSLYISENGDSVYIDRFAFYISSISLRFDDGDVYTEPDSYHLIDFQNSSSTSLKLTGLPNKPIAAISYAIGVDSTACVSGALGVDLDPMHGMIWAWHSGYINAKLEGRSPQLNTHHQAFEYHIGGFLPIHATLRPVELTLTHPISSTQITIQADAAKWFDNIDISELNRIVMPGQPAVQMADRYATMFSIVE